MALPSTSIGENSYLPASETAVSSHATNFRQLAQRFSTQVLEHASARQLRLEAEARKEQEKRLKAKMEQSAATKAEAEQMLGQIKRTVTTRVEYEKIKEQIKPELAEEHKEVQGMSAHALGMQAMLTSKAEFESVMSQIINSPEKMFEKNLLTLLETEILQRDNYYQKLKNQKREPEVAHITQDEKMKWLAESLPIDSEKSAKSYSI